MTDPAPWPADGLRVLDAGAAPPAWNMAIDEALLLASGPPTLRLYRWDPPGLSLGWFQDGAAFAEVPGRHRVVRRRTGGGAIYHDDELTFALTLDAELLPKDVAASYVLLHTAVQVALAAVGVPTELVRGAGAPSGRSRGSGWCFATAGPHDLVAAASRRKIVGSAQRRVRAPRARVLHHGSIVLHAPTATPFCGAVADSVDPHQVEDRLRNELSAALATALRLRPMPGTLTPAEQSSARDRLSFYEDAGRVAR
ncbi:MAG: hypothetical protein R3F56_19580 [Planctomycetota bacterium]